MRYSMFVAKGICLLATTTLGIVAFTRLPASPEPVHGRRTTVETSDAESSRRSLAVSSEGLAGIGVADWQAAGHTGAGTKVAVLDLGFDGWEDVPADGSWNLLSCRLFRPM